MMAYMYFVYDMKIEMSVFRTLVKLETLYLMCDVYKNDSLHGVCFPDSDYGLIINFTNYKNANKLFIFFLIVNLSHVL